MIYHSGHVVTVDEPFTIAEAFAIKDDRFIAVGTNAGVEALAGADTQRVDLQGQTVIPGLMDNHMPHVLEGALHAPRHSHGRRALAGGRC